MTSILKAKLRALIICIVSIVTTQLYGTFSIAQTRLFEISQSIHCIKISPDTLFQGVKLSPGMDSTQCLVVTNCGDSIESVLPYFKSNNYDYEILSPIITHHLKLDSSFTICVTYHPQTLGNKTDSIIIKPGEPIRLLASTPCAHVFASPDTIDFGSVAINSLAKDTILLTNDGDIPFVTNGLYPQELAFRVINYYSDTILPHQKIPLILAFDPWEAKKDSVLFHFNDISECSNTLSFFARGEAITAAVGTTESKDFSLNQNFPNPFSKQTTFNFTTPKETTIQLSLLDLGGKLTKSLISGRVSQGEHTVLLDASDLPSGTYILLLQSGDVKLSREIILTK